MEEKYLKILMKLKSLSQTDFKNNVSLKIQLSWPLKQPNLDMIIIQITLSPIITDYELRKHDWVHKLYINDKWKMTDWVTERRFQKEALPHPKIFILNMIRLKIK